MRDPPAMGMRSVSIVSEIAVGSRVGHGQTPTLPRHRLSSVGLSSRKSSVTSMSGFDTLGLEITNTPFRRLSLGGLAANQKKSESSDSSSDDLNNSAVMDADDVLADPVGDLDTIIQEIRDRMNANPDLINPYYEPSSKMKISFFHHMLHQNSQVNATLFKASRLVTRIHGGEVLRKDHQDRISELQRDVIAQAARVQTGVDLLSSAEKQIKNLEEKHEKEKHSLNEEFEWRIQNERIGWEDKLYEHQNVLEETVKTMAKETEVAVALARKEGAGRNIQHQLQTTTQKLQEIQKQKATLDAEHLAVKTRLQKLEIKLLNTVNELSSSRDDYMNELMKNQSLKGEINNQEHLINNLQDEISSSHDKIRDLRKAVAEPQEIVPDPALEVNHNLLRVTLEAMEEENVNLKDQVNEQTDKYELAKIDILEWEQKSRDLNDFNSQLQFEVEESKTLTATLEADLDTEQRNAQTAHSRLRDIVLRTVGSAATHVELPLLSIGFLRLSKNALTRRFQKRLERREKRLNIEHESRKEQIQLKHKSVVSDLERQLREAKKNKAPNKIPSDNVNDDTHSPSKEKKIGKHPIVALRTGTCRVIQEATCTKEIEKQSKELINKILSFSNVFSGIYKLKYKPLSKEPPEGIPSSLHSLRQGIVALSAFQRVLEVRKNIAKIRAKLLLFTVADVIRAKRLNKKLQMPNVPEKLRAFWERQRQALEARKANLDAIKKLNSFMAAEQDQNIRSLDQIMYERDDKTLAGKLNDAINNYENDQRQISREISKYIICDVYEKQSPPVSITGHGGTGLFAHTVYNPKTQVRDNSPPTSHVQCDPWSLRQGMSSITSFGLPIIDNSIWKRAPPSLLKSVPSKKITSNHVGEFFEPESFLTSIKYNPTNILPQRVLY